MGRGFEEEKQLLLSEKRPSGAFATPERIGRLDGFLCSESAAQMTETSLAVNGGWTAR